MTKQEKARIKEILGFTYDWKRERLEWFQRRYELTQGQASRWVETKSNDRK